MPIFQPGGDNAGYRGPAKTLTIKALQDRQAALAAAQDAAAANAAPITNMWQGAGALANSLGDSMQMSRAANQESDARAQLAGIMAQIDPNQGASMQQIAAMQQLDPDFANKEYMRAMEERAAIANREDQQRAATDLQTGQQTFTAGESELSRGATAEQNDLTRQAEAARQQELFGHQDTTAATLAGTNEAAAISDDARAAEADKVAAENNRKQAALEAAYRGKTPAEIQAAVEAEILSPETGKALTEAYVGGEQAATTKTEAEATEAVQGTQPGAPMTDEDLKKWGIKDTERGDWYMDPKDGRPKKLSEYNAGASQQRKDVGSAKGDLVTLDTGLNEMQRALELVDNILPMGELGKWGADKAGWVPDAAIPADLAKQIDATKRFYQIIEGSALKTMSAELKGSTALGELNRYISILADPNTSNEVKKQTIAAISNKLHAGRAMARDALKMTNGEDAGDWVYSNPDVMPGDTGAGTTTPAPAVVDDRPAVEKYKPRSGR